MLDNKVFPRRSLSREFFFRTHFSGIASFIKLKTLAIFAQAKLISNSRYSFEASESIMIENQLTDDWVEISSLSVALPSEAFFTSSAWIVFASVNGFFSIPTSTFLNTKCLDPQVQKPGKQSQTWKSIKVVRRNWTIAVTL